MGFFDKETKKCRHCDVKIPKPISEQNSRVDDLMKRSKIASQVYRDNNICISCQTSSSVVSSASSLEALGPDNITTENLFAAHKKKLKKPTSKAFWIFIIIIALVKINSSLGLFDDEDTEPYVKVNDDQAVFEEINEADLTNKIVTDGKAEFSNSPGTWVRANDYPAAAIREEREGTVLFKLTVSVQGLVRECIVTQSSGHEDLDNATCQAIQKRARFYRSVDENGNPIESEFSNRVKWQIPK